MNDVAISLAIVDALNPDQHDAASRPQPCRYLAPIANIPLICHVLDGLAHDGIEKALIVAHDQARRSIAEVVRNGKDWGLEVSFVEADQDTPRALLSEVRAAVADSTALLHSGDCLFPGQVAHLQERFRASDLDLAVLVRSGAPYTGAVSEPWQPRRLLSLPRDRPPGTAMILGPAVWPMLEKLSCDSLDVQRLVDALCAGGHRVGTYEAEAHWCYRGSSEQLLVANRMVLDARPSDSTRAGVRRGSNADGQVAVSPSARVTRSTLRGPAVIGANAVVEDSFVGPYTAIGPRATVVGTEVENSMVLADAQVLYPGQRVEASVIGERAEVTRSFALPAGLHLRIGPDATVILG